MRCYLTGSPLCKATLRRLKKRDRASESRTCQLRYGSSIRTRNAAAGFCKRCFDELSFLINQRRLQINRRLCFRLQPRLFHRERVGIAEDHGSFDDILKLPDIARPVITLQKLRCPLFYASNPLAPFSSVAFDEIPGEQKNIFRALTKRRDMDWKDVQTVEQIQTKPAGMNCRRRTSILQCFSRKFRPDP